MFQSSDMVVISEGRLEEQTPAASNFSEEVREGLPVASMSSEETAYTPAAKTPFERICNMEIEAPICTKGAAQFTVSEEKMRALQAPISSTGATQFFAREEKRRTSEQFVRLSEAIRGLGNICSTEFEASPAPSSSADAVQFTGSVEGTRTSEQLVTLLNVMGEVIEGVENYCLLEGRPVGQTRRSPLPLWYPRRPLQDITSVLNIGPVPPEDASVFKKGSKKYPTVHLHQHAHDNRGGSFGQQRTLRVPFKPTSSVSASSKRSSLLRKGFR